MYAAVGLVLAAVLSRWMFPDGSPSPDEMVTRGLHKVENGVVGLLKANPGGLTNAEIARSTNTYETPQDGRGRHKGWLTYYMLRDLVDKGEVARIELPLSGEPLTVRKKAAAQKKMRECYVNRRVPTPVRVAFNESPRVQREWLGTKPTVIYRLV